MCQTSVVTADRRMRHFVCWIQRLGLRAGSLHVLSRGEPVQGADGFHVALPGKEMAGCHEHFGTWFFFSRSEFGLCFSFLGVTMDSPRGRAGHFPRYHLNASCNVCQSSCSLGTLLLPGNNEEGVTSSWQHASLASLALHLRGGRLQKPCPSARRP